MDIDPIIYHDPEASSHLPKRGDLLVASPFLTEAVFSHAVILLLDAGKEGGCLGLALNKKSTITLQDIFPVLDVVDPIDVYCGGPVGGDRLFMLHSLDRNFGESLEVAPGVFVGGDPEKIVEYIIEGGPVNGHIRFFLGYSGWADGQLKEELRAGSWAIGNEYAGLSLLEGRGTSFWRRAVSSLGPDYRSWLNVPKDPSMN